MTWSTEPDGPSRRLPAGRRARMERRYRRLLTLYPRAHRQEHAEEMIGVLFAAADYDARIRAPKPAAWALRSAQHVADCADLVAGAARIRGRMVVGRVKQATRSSWMVRDRRWGDALAVVSVIAPLLLLVAALAEFHLPQAVASSLTGHPQWRLTATLVLGDLPLAAGAPAVAVLALLRQRRLAGLGAVAAATGQVAAAMQRPAPAFTGYSSPVAAFTVLLACTAAVAAGCLRAPVSRRVLALLAIPVIPYAVLWQDKLASDLFGQAGAASASISSTLPLLYLLYLLYLPPLLLAGVIVAGTWLARRRATRHVRSASPTGSRSAVSA